LTNLVFIPCLRGEPAIVISSEGLFVNAIGQIIPWQEIKSTKAIPVNGGYIFKIYVRNEANLPMQTKSITKRIRWRLSDMAIGTAFSFNTILISGFGFNICESIENEIDRRTVPDV